MSHIIRIIPKLDIKGHNLIKGLQFDGYRVLGQAEDYAELYYQEGADELIFQDAVASLYRRDSLLEIVKRIADKIFIPLTVAGGVRSLADIEKLLRAGADKVAINTAAVSNPKLLRDASIEFGSQNIVSAIDVYVSETREYQVWTHYGREATHLKFIDWVKQVEQCGVGEILLTSINRDGMGKGYDKELISLVCDSVSIPVIACGGAGKENDFLEVLKETTVDALSSASCFHYFYVNHFLKQLLQKDNRYALRKGAQFDVGNFDFLREGYGAYRDLLVRPCGISNIKDYLRQHGFPMRLQYSLPRKVFCEGEVFEAQRV